MKFKALASHIFLAMCVVFFANISIGMIKEKSLLEEFDEIKENLPAGASSINLIKAALLNVPFVLQKSPPDFATAIKILEKLKITLKSINFVTATDTYDGEQFIDVYFGDFINKLKQKVAEASAPSPKQPTSIKKEVSKPSLAQKFADILDTLEAKNVATLKKYLTIVQNFLSQEEPNLSEALDALQKLKQNNAIKKMQFDTPLGQLPGEQFIDLYFGDFINQLIREIAKTPQAPKYIPFTKKLKEESLTQEFDKILNNIPETDERNQKSLRLLLLKFVQEPLSQAEPNLQEALTNFNKIRQSKLIKDNKFQTLKGPLPGPDLFTTYFNDFVVKLDKTIKAQAAAAAIKKEAPVKKIDEEPLAKEFTEILNNIPETDENNQTLKQQLKFIQDLLSQPKPDLNGAFISLHNIKQSKFVKENQFSSLLTEVPVSGEQFFAIFFDEFIKKLKDKLEALKTHVPGTPYGLVNQGNACYMNSSVQALRSLQKITDLLLTLPDDYYLADTISALYVKLLKTMQTEKQAVINPLPFCLRGRALMGGPGQQDAAEFVQLLLQDLAANDINPVRNPANVNKALQDLVKITITERIYDQNNKPIGSETHDHLVIPPASIDPENKTLLNCLENYFGIRQHPSQENKKIATALMQTSNYLLIRLQRVTFSQALKQALKNEQPISFELNNFDVSSLSLTGKKFLLYRCKAFIAHSGVATGGHYIAYIRINNNWFICDDTHVTPVSTDEVRDFAQKGARGPWTPLMFFYEQQQL
jgi:ubiquitin carboxyl-terminal hydrolase